VLFRIRRGSNTEKASIAPVVADPAPPATEAAVPVPPADPLPFRQKSQLTGQDARAERLVLGVRSEVSELREYVSALRERAGEAFALDIESVIADPALAVTIPPRLFLDEILRQRERIHELDAALAALNAELQKALDADHDASLRLAVSEARRETLGEVIAALHANLEDLRALRVPAAAPTAHITGPGRSG